MAISTELETILAATPDLLKTVQDMDVKASKVDELLPKVEAAKKLGEDLEAVKRVNLDLIEQRKTWKIDKEATVSKPDYNALAEQLDNIKKDLESEKTIRTSKEKEADSARLESLTKDLRSSVISVASTVKAINPQQVFLLMQGEGLIGLKDGKLFFNKLNEAGEATTSTAEEATKTYLDKNKHLISPSGNVGTGNTHTGKADADSDKPMTKEQARRELIGAYTKK